MTAVLPAPTMDATNTDVFNPEQLARPDNESDADRAEILHVNSYWLQEYRDGVWRLPGRYNKEPKVIVSITCTSTTEATCHNRARCIAIARMEALGFDPSDFTEFWDWTAGTLVFTRHSPVKATNGFNPGDQDRHTWDDLNTFPR